MDDGWRAATMLSGTGPLRLPAIASFCDCECFKHPLRWSPRLLKVSVWCALGQKEGGGLRLQSREFRGDSWRLQLRLRVLFR